MDGFLGGINDNNSRNTRENNRMKLSLSNEDNQQLIDNSDDEQSISYEQNENEQRLA